MYLPGAVRGWPMVTILRRRWRVSGTIRIQLRHTCCPLPAARCLLPVVCCLAPKFMATFNSRVYVTGSELNLHKSRDSPFSILHLPVSVCRRSSLEFSRPSHLKVSLSRSDCVCVCVQVIRVLWKSFIYTLAKNTI